jgi:peptidoglycan hydrolase-like protein with peptidoglycan-binding domain
MLRLFTCAMALAMATLCWSAASSTGRKTTKSGSKSAKSARKAPAKKPVAAWRTRQIAPTAERYRQIQQALAAKGFLRPEEATGVWGASSMEAMKQFQESQKIAASGKINSLSLIALGLGPKREAVAVKPPALPAQ